MPFSGTVSLVVAVTGHRDLFPEDVARIQAEIEAIFSELRLQYSDTPLLLLSGMAEGADRIAVRAAQAANVDYIAVLPMPRVEYVRDFADAASVQEFEDLCAGAVRCIELPVTEESRERHYERLGEFLVKHSRILIAVWDRSRPGKQGGTGEVVRMKQAADPNGAGPLYVLPVRTLSSSGEVRYPKQK